MIVQRISYKIQLKNEIIINNGVEEMLAPKYTPVFIREMEEVIKGKHLGPFKSAHELDEFIRNMPEETEDE